MATGIGAPSAISVNNTPEFCVNVGSSEYTKAAFTQFKDMNYVNSLYSSCKKDNSSIKRIQRTIKNLQNFLEDVKRYSNINSISEGLAQNVGIGTTTFSSVISTKEPWKTISKYITGSSADIATDVKNLLGPIRGWVLNQIQKQVSKVSSFLFPGEQQELNEIINNGINGISCAFAKVVRLLQKTVEGLILQLIDKYVNGPLCLIEDFIGNLLQKILDPIFGAIKSALDSIGGGLNAIGSIGENLFNMLDFVTGVLNFFRCDDDRSCPEVQELNLAGFIGKGGDTISEIDASKYMTKLNTAFTEGGGNGENSGTQFWKVSQQGIVV